MPPDITVTAMVKSSWEMRMASVTVNKPTVNRPSEANYSYSLKSFMNWGNYRKFVVCGPAADGEKGEQDSADKHPDPAGHQEVEHG